MFNNDLIVEHVYFGVDDIKDKYHLYDCLLEKLYIEMDISDKFVFGKTFDLLTDTYFKNSNLNKNSVDYEIKTKSLTYFLKNKNDYLGGIICRPTEEFIDTCIISIVLIFSQFRSHGYGKYLLNYVLNDLKTKYNFKHFGLRCMNCNDVAVKLYQSFGFSPMATFMLKM